MNLEDYSIIAWFNKFGIKTESGIPYDLKNHMFWFDILRDFTPEQVWLKAAQVGGSTVAVLKLLWAMKRYSINAAYTLPTAGDAREFVTGKMNPIITQNPVLQGYTKDRDTIEQKQIAGHTLYIRGTWTTRAALSFSSDLNVHDEIDRSKLDVIEQYSSRQQHSTFKWNWRFSNPSSVGNGVDKFWKQSDQKHWIITCHKCKQKQFLSWPDSVDLVKQAYVCKKCHVIIPDEVRAKGFWHKMASGDISGYWISLLMAPWIPASYVIKMSQEKTQEFFYNFVLGLPFEGTGGKLSEDEFFSNLDSTPYAIEDPIVIGLDTGLPNWYVVGGNMGMFSMGKCDGYDEIEKMLQRWPKSVLICDQGGDLTKPRELLEKYPGRVYLCYFRLDRKTIQLVDWGKKDEDGKVIADRNRVIQMLMDEFKSRRIPLKGNRLDWYEMWQHIANMYRTVDEDQLGNERIVWQRNGADHLFLAAVYWRIGMEKFGLTDGPKFINPVNNLFSDSQKGVYIDPITGGASIDQYLPFNEERDERDV